MSIIGVDLPSTPYPGHKNMHVKVSEASETSTHLGFDPCMVNTKQDKYQTETSSMSKSTKNELHIGILSRMGSSTTLKKTCCITPPIYTSIIWLALSLSLYPMRSAHQTPDLHARTAIHLEMLKFKVTVDILGARSSRVETS